MKALTFSILCFASIVFGDDFKTIEGKEYKNVTVRRVEPDGIVLTSSSGISKVYFTDLPKEVQERFHYDQAKSAAYSVEQNANFEAMRKQREEEDRHRNDAKQAQIAEAQPRERQEAQPKENLDAVQYWQSRYRVAQEDEAGILSRIGRAEDARRSEAAARYRGMLQQSSGLVVELPLLYGQLNNVRDEKNRAQQRIEQARQGMEQAQH